jgi:hypothetical protein
MLVLVTAGIALTAHAQPGPEQKKLDYLSGKWRMEMDVKGSGTTPGSKASGTEECESLAGMHVVCRSEASGAAGLYKSMRVMSYVPAIKQHTSYTVDSIGYAVLSTGQIQGSSWTFMTDLGGGAKSRYTMKTSKDTYTATSEYAGADGKWMTTSTASFTRVK